MKTTVTTERSKGDINWDVPQIVQLDSDPVLLYTTGEHTETTFSAIIIKDYREEEEGYYDDSWEKEGVLPFVGKVIMEQ